MKNQHHKNKWLSLILVMAFLSSSLTACADDVPSNGSFQPGIELAKSEKSRQTDPDVSQNDLDQLNKGNNQFAFELFQALKGENDNLFFSPYSISVALAMTYTGARGTTEAQMAETLRFLLSQERLHPAINQLDLLFTPPHDANPQNGPAFQLNIANSLWGQKDYPFLPKFLDIIALNYGSGLRLVDFIPEDKREEARQAINHWVEQETSGKIEELIEKDILTDYTRLVLANAIYFKGEWQDPFINGTDEHQFYLLDGSSTIVPMMSRRKMTAIVQGDGFQAIVLPYKGERMEMIVLLPESGSYEDFETSLDADRFNQILAQVEPFSTKLYMPKFEFDTSLKLENTLAEMGMPDAFNENLADFSGMYDFDKVGRKLFIAHVVHKAYVAVDEMGTEAAAATGVVVEDESLPLEIRIDRPFIFLIHDNQTGTILFIGRVLEP
jgi:serpin B